MKNRWIKYDSVQSTNSLVSAMLKEQAMEEGTILIADYQEGGKGLGDHSWLSNRGENLLMSLLLYPAFLSASLQFHLSRVASLAVCDALKSFGVDTLIKWPNDILSEKGKIAGILIENGITAGNITHTIIGIGLNLNQMNFPSFQVPASSLRLETGKVADVSGVGKLLAEHLMNRYREIKKGHTGQLEKEYREKLYLAGVPSVFQTDAGELEGVIMGVNDFGELIVESDRVLQTFAHGAIHMPLNVG